MTEDRFDRLNANGEKTRFPFAHQHDLYFNPTSGVLGMVTGIGTANSATAVMALGLDPRFDLSKAYWLVAGVSGVDPADASIGSAAWAEYLVDGDLRIFQCTEAALRFNEQPRPCACHYA